MLLSNYRPLVPVTLPPMRGRQHYMHTFSLSAPSVPRGFEDYLPVIQQLCAAAGATEGIAHATFDEKVVRAGMSQRRPGPHVDGCFMPSSETWGHEGGGWLHTCNDIRRGAPRRMPVIIAASAVGCRAWKGDFDGQPKTDGDLSHIATQLTNGEVLPANVGYLLSADCVHESMILPVDTPRVFLRIALPNDRDYAI